MTRYIKRLIRQLFTSTGPAASEIAHLDGHTLRDLGIDRMAAEHQRNARLWQKLAS